MRKPIGWAIITMWAGAASAQTSPPIPPPPPVLAYDLASYPAAGATTSCTEGQARVADGPAPPPIVQFRSAAVGGSGPVAPPPSARSYRFSITGEGRVTGVRRMTEATPVPPGAAVSDSLDQPIEATLAAWRFAPGRALSGCRYEASPRLTPLETVDRPSLLTLMAQTRPGLGREIVVRRARELAGGDCTRGRRPDPRLLAFPPFKELAARPGRRDWLTLGFDLDAAGQPIRVERLASSGNVQLDAEGRRALESSRFEPGARRGCIHSLARAADTLSAPPRPNLSAFVRPGDDCPNTEGRSGRIKFVDGERFYPQAFRERSIQGWAVIRFDVAPWGQLGPPEVVAAEPAAAFGEAARSLTRTARAEPGPGWRGCLQHFIFDLADEGEQIPFERDLTLR